MNEPATEVDALLQDVLARVSDGLEFETATQAINDGLHAIGAQMKALRGKSYKRLKAPEVARALAHTQKGLDELYRLVQFAKGAPDSRPDLGADWLRGLSTPQLRQVERWIEDNARVSAEAPKP